MRFDSSFGHRRSAFHNLVVFGIMAVFGLIVVSAGCSDFTYGRTVEGRVAQDPGSRFKGGTEGSRGEEKIVITLSPVHQDAKVEEVAGGPSGTIIECVSSRCAQVKYGQCHRFACKYEYRFNEPDVIRCKHEKELKCEGDLAEASK